MRYWKNKTPNIQHQTIPSWYQWLIVSYEAKQQSHLSLVGLHQQRQFGQLQNIRSRLQQLRESF